MEVVLKAPSTIVSNTTFGSTNSTDMIETGYDYRSSTQAEFVVILSLCTALGALSIAAYAYDTATKMKRIRHDDHVKDAKVTQAYVIHISAQKHNIIAMVCVWLCMCYLFAMSWFIVVQKRDVDPMVCIAAVSLGLGFAFIFQLLGSCGSLKTFRVLAKSSDMELADRPKPCDNNTEENCCSGGLVTPCY